ncbi:Cleavage stimulation factor subunit 77 [Nosema granulosis]|uniref:Cleavage stimulation factor subunit 77 n=1 Tax=Nosema granulosis TaxID=83296 RepID=A0A9P6GZI2_9MICR|nr:Cleavage stimulation factor subunit 77 [Nosema granulosis]
MNYLEKLQKENNIDLLYECVTYLEDLRDYETLESVFRNHLIASCDIRIWRAYLNYTTKTKKLRNREIYEFTIKNIGHHWESTDIYREYINVLLRGEDTTDKLDTIRGLYLRMFRIPLSSLMDVYNSYEEFENEFNKLNARRLLAEITPLYQNSYKVYNNTIGFLNNPSIENCARLIDVERQNPLNLDEKHFLERLDFIYRYFISIFYKNEEPVYFYVDYLLTAGDYGKAREVLEKSLTDTTSIFLKIYYAKQIGEHKSESQGQSNAGIKYLLDILSQQYDDVVAVNLLNFVLKKEGLEAFRRMFIRLKLYFPIGPTVYRYAAETEFYSGNNKKTACDIFTMGLEIFPEESGYILQEAFLDFLLSVGDEDNAKALFKKSIKSAKMWDTMIKYEYLYGGDVQYRELLNERVNYTHSQEEKEPSPVGILLKYSLEKKNLSFGLAMDHPKQIYDFIFSLPCIEFKDNFLCCVDLENIQEIVKNIKI